MSTVSHFPGFTASAFGRLILVNQDWFVAISGVIVMDSGAHFIGVCRIFFIDREMRIDAGVRGGSAIGAYVPGLAFAFGRTPCIGAIPGEILSLAASNANEADVARGATLLAAYAAGLGIPFLLVAAFFPRLSGLFDWIRRHMVRIEGITGLLPWTVGLSMLTGKFTDFSWWLNETFPVLQTFR